MDNYTIETHPFEEDETPPWLLKQKEEAKEVEALAIKKEKILYREGNQVGNFLFVRYMRYKNRALFACQECGRKFQYNIYTIKNKKRCKWQKFHNRAKRS